MNDLENWTCFATFNTIGVVLFTENSDEFSGSINSHHVPCQTHSQGQSLNRLGFEPCNQRNMENVYKLNLDLYVDWASPTNFQIQEFVQLEKNETKKGIGKKFNKYSEKKPKKEMLLFLYNKVKEAVQNPALQKKSLKQKIVFRQNLLNLLPLYESIFFLFYSIYFYAQTNLSRRKKAGPFSNWLEYLDRRSEWMHSKFNGPNSFSNGYDWKKDSFFLIDICG